MFDRFGEFDSVEELNRAAEGQKEEGDEKALKELALENGIDPDEAEDYMNGATDRLATPRMAAIGKLEVEEKCIECPEIMEDWLGYIKQQCIDDEDMARAVRRKGKSLEGCIAALLKWSFNHQETVDAKIMEAAGVKVSRCTWGCPGMGTAKKVIKKYYMGE